MRRRFTPVTAGIFAFFLASLTSTVRGDDTTAAGWSTRVWAEDGLSDRSISGVAQTPDGFLWVANRIGLARFDGAHFTEFPLSAIGGETHHRIRILQPSRTGGLWIVTDASRATGIPFSERHSRLIHLQGEVAQVWSSNLPNAPAETMVEDTDGKVWITYHGGAVVRVGPDTVTDFTRSAAAFGEGDCMLTRDREGRIWFSQHGVIGLLRGERFERLITLRDIRTHILGSQAGGIWIGSTKRLLRYREGGEVTELTSEAVWGTLLEDRDGALWIGSATEGLFRCSANGRLSHIPTSNAVITSLVQDQEGSLWVGTHSGGLNQIRPKSITIEGSVTGLPTQAIRSLCEDPAGRHWGVTSNGLLVLREGESWSSASFAATIANRLTCVAADASGTLWAGSAFGAADQRLYAWDHGRLRTWGVDEGLDCTLINQLFASRSGDLWIAASNPATIARVRDGKLTVFPLPPRSSTNGITALTEDANGVMWFGTGRGELLRNAGDRIENVSALAPSQKRIHTLRGTSDGSLWIGYSTAGLGRLKGSEFGLIDADAGLLSGGVTHIVPDTRDGLWMAGDHGVFWVRQEDLAAVAEQRAERVQPIRIRDTAGRSDLAVFSTESGAELRSRDGRIWLGLGPTLMVIDPKLFDQNEHSPPTRLMGVFIDGQPAAIYRGILPASAFATGGVPTLPQPKLVARVAASHRKIDFEFTTLNLADPENVAFKYRLLGYDESWTDPSVERRATFRRLPAGTYTFEVTSCSRSGRWNDQPASITFAVAPVFWKTWWWESAALAVFAGSIYLAARSFTNRRLRRRVQKLRQEAALARERARIARDIHDDIGNRLTQITLLSGLGRRHRADATKAEEHFLEIGTATAEVTKSLDEIVWAVNPRNDTLAHLLGYLSKFAVEFLRAAGVRCDVERPDPIPPFTVPADVRHNLFLAVKEALSNVARHAAATEVRLNFELRENLLTATISDNGCGLHVSGDDPDADGLLNMRNRMEEIGGRFEAGANPLGGTRIVLAVPLPRAE